jgi:cobalt-zinc-cadmium efflux system protein
MREPDEHQHASAPHVEGAVPHHDHSHASGLHGHTHGHGHSDHHAHDPEQYDRAFVIGIALNVAFVLVEAGFGLLSGSLALLADAGHNLSDVLALIIALGATILSRRVPTARRTYGWRRSSILAALANALALVVVVGIVGWEAIQRLLEPRPVEGGVMIVVAAAGVLVNGVAALLFLGGRQHDANLRAAFLHLAADAAVSVGVVVAGVAILITGWLWLDPAISLGISAIILLSTWHLLREALDMALDAVPAGVDERRVRTYLEGLPGVADVHDLHIWAMSTTQTALTVHLVMRNPPRDDALLAQVAGELRGRFTIEHATLQIECGDAEYPCILASPHLV